MHCMRDRRKGRVGVCTLGISDEEGSGHTRARPHHNVKMLQCRTCQEETRRNSSSPNILRGVSVVTYEPSRAASSIVTHMCNA